MGRIARLPYVADMRSVTSDHARLDERSLALHRQVAEKLLADPALLDKARGKLRRWRERHGGLSSALAGWDAILSGTPDRVAC